MTQTIAIIGALTGLFLGLLGSLLGIWASWRDAPDLRSKLTIIGWSGGFLVLIGGFLTALLFVDPSVRGWLWMVYLVFLPMSVLLCNRHLGSNNRTAVVRQTPQSDQHP